MRKLALAALVALASATPASPVLEPSAPKPPDARRVDLKETFHGVEVPDAYRWLEDQKSPETRAWVDAQNAYTRSLLEGRPARQAIAKRFDELMRVDHVFSPTHGGNRYFVWKKRSADDLSILYVREGLDGKDEVLIDPHALSHDHTTNVTLMDVALDGRKIVYGLRKGGEDEVELHVLDVDTRTDLKDVFPRALYDQASLTPDGGGFYYTWRSRATGARVRFHKLGTPVESDREIFGEGHGPGDWIGAGVSDDGKHLLIGVQQGWATSDVYAQELPDGKILPIARDEKALFNAQIAGDTLVIRT
ncbi:MAG: S9 family peptidase, partial [Acidobacteria bacterium]|nr:S9 family peptidase [Acidobacteriota bacterium]